MTSRNRCVSITGVLSVPDVVSRKSSGVPLVMVTAYDANGASIASSAGVDLILVGDSLAMVVHGFDDTLQVGMDVMELHVASVARGRPDALIVGDLPWLSYHLDVPDAIRNAARLVRAGAGAVKLEGGHRRVPVVRALVQAEIPVMGHLGLTPQSVHAFGGFKVQGRDPDHAKQLLEDAYALADAGCFSIVLEGIPGELARAITEAVPVPTIGIGAGPYCDGQVLVYHDVLGLQDTIRPRFVRRYADLRAEAVEALQHFARDVRSGAFPTAAESYGLGAGVAQGQATGLYGSSGTATRTPVVISDPEEFGSLLERRRLGGARVGFVPTMGALHDGHRSLIARAAAECDVVAVSVFVNPLQFGPGEDLDRYPRDLEADVRLAGEAGAGIVFAPSATDLFPAPFRTGVHVEGLTDVLEGAARPGHFDGVTTVVARLLGLVGGCRAYFGEKDFQQLAVVRQMVRDLALGAQIVGCPIVRERDGLARSSRNAYLSPEERAAAPVLQRGLLAGVAAGARRPLGSDAVCDAVRGVLAAEERLEVDYVAVVDPASLTPSDDATLERRILVAARIGSTRLIDNVELPAFHG